MKKTTAVCSFVLLLLTACEDAPGGENISPPGASSENHGTDSAIPHVDHWLTITDSIGVELGDSNLVFGTVSSAQFSPDGNIVIADVLKTRIGIFSPDGEFLCTLGRSGSGPGEFLQITSFAVASNGSIIVPDAMGAKLNFYDPDHNFTESITGFFPAAPLTVSPVEEGFVGLKPEFEMTEDHMNIGVGIYHWTNSAVSDFEYVKNMVPFDTENINSLLTAVIVYDTDHDDNLITAPYSTSEYIITSQTLQGNQNWQIVEEFDAVRKSREEIVEEQDLLRSKMVASGTPVEMMDCFQTEEYKVFIDQLEVDNLNRLWVLNNFYDMPMYRVYDCSTGEFLFTAALRTGPTHHDILPCINSYGITGISVESSDWPRVYIITPEDPGLFQE